MAPPGRIAAAELNQCQATSTKTRYKNRSKIVAGLASIAEIKNEKSIYLMCFHLIDFVLS